MHSLSVIGADSSSSLRVMVFFLRFLAGVSTWARSKGREEREGNRVSIEGEREHEYDYEYDYE